MIPNLLQIYTLQCYYVYLIKTAMGITEAIIYRKNYWPDIINTIYKYVKKYDC